LVVLLLVLLVMVQELTLACPPLILETTPSNNKGSLDSNREGVACCSASSREVVLEGEGWWGGLQVEMHQQKEQGLSLVEQLRSSSNNSTNTNISTSSRSLLLCVHHCPHIRPPGRVLLARCWVSPPPSGDTDVCARSMCVHTHASILPSTS
jgi:hypothetical protein